MTLKSVIAILCLLILLPACGRRGKDRGVAEAESDTTALSEQATLSTEEELAALTDTAQQEEVDAWRPGEAAGAYLYVSKRKMRLYVVSRHDSVLFSCGIACGARRGNKEERGDYRTPEGRFRISGMFDSTDWIHRTKDGRAVKGCYGPYFLRIATGRWIGIGIHGTNAPRSIGRRASEGCIRVKSENIVEIFDRYAYDGMPVIVGSEQEPLPPFAGLGTERTEPEKAAADTLVSALPDSAAAAPTHTPTDTLHHPATVADSAPPPPAHTPEATDPAEHETADSARFQ